MNKGRKFVYAIVFALALFVVASCGIIDDTHVHLYVEGTCECGDKEVNWPELPKHTVSFVDDNGKLISEASVLEGSLVQEPVSPTKEGEHFVGWYNGEVKWNFEKNPVLGEITLKAHFVENAKYEITYELNGGEFKKGEEVEVEYISGIGTESLATPVKEHYVFVGWFMNNERVTKIPAHKEGNVTLVAKWALVEHTILFDTNGGEFNPGAKLPNEFKETVGLEKLPTPSRIGYTFVSWTLDGEEVSSISKEVTKDVVLVAKWQINEYTLTFNIDGKEQKVVYDYNESVAQPMDPEKEGYTFLGWDKEIPANMPADDVTVTALWQINKYNVTFKLENGEKDVVTVQNYGTAIKAPTPEKTGYTFKGWDVSVPETVPASDVTAVAVWEINKYTVTFKLENGEKDVVTVQNYGTAIKAPTPEKTGYTFKGWDVLVPETVPAEDVTAVAVWEINKYTVTFKLENGEADVQNVLEYGAKITAPQPEKEGYAFVGWDKEVAQTVSTSNLVYTAKWEINQYMVTFKLGNGEADVILKQDYQTAIKAPTPTREGYAFKGWDIEVPETVPAYDVVAVAVWEINKYTVTFVLGNGEADIQQELEYGAKITVPTPIRLGYTFKGWDVLVPETVPANDVTAVAQWEIKSIITVKEALLIGNQYDKDKYTSEKFVIEGTIISIESEQYGNLYIEQDGEKILVYGLYSEDGKIRYDSLDVKPLVGDYIKVKGAIGKHDDPQMKNGWLVEHVAHEHKYENHVCTICGKDDPNYVPELPEGVEILATFELGTNGSAAHYDGSSKSSYSETVGDYTLSIVSGTNMYTGARDAKGNSAIKFGTSSKTGSMSFTVSENVTEVRIYVAKYKANTTKVTINGTTHTLKNNSNDGQYDIIIVDTSKTKTVTFTTVSGGVRAMVNTIEFLGAEPELPSHEHIICPICKGCTDPECPEDNKCLGHEPVHEHVVCPICKGCTDPECPEDNKCLGHEEEGPKEVSIAEAKELTDGTEVIISGTVKSIDTAWSEQYSNITVTIIDKTGEIQLYRLATKVVLGDIITVTGKVGSFNNNKQIAQGATAEITGHDTSYDPSDEVQKVTIAEALLLVDGSKVEIKATVDKIMSNWDTQYSNMEVNIIDETGVLYVYRMITKVEKGDIIVITGEMTTYNETRQIAKGATAEIIGHDTSYDVVESNVREYLFSDYTAGTQYAENESHKLDEIITVTTTQAHFTTQLRLYSSSTHNGFAIIESTKVIKSITLNAGNKKDTLNVYGSADGKTWTLISGISITSTSYNDYSLEIGEANNYKFLKLDVKGSNQIRIASMEITFSSDN